MNITKENFNEYVDLATFLAEVGIFIEAVNILGDAFEAWNSWREEKDKSLLEVNVGQAVRILVYSERRKAEEMQSYDMFNGILNHYPYWSDEFIEANHNFTGAWILREKALAYYMLAQNWATDQLCDLYLDYAQSYMKQAIDTFGEVAKTENDAVAAELCTDCKIELAMIRRGISNKLARMTAISLFGEKLTYEQKERLLDVYQQSTEVLFDDFFIKKKLAVMMNSEIEDDNVKEDAIHSFLEEYSEPGNDDPYWWDFTHKITLVERKKIRFVEKIEDAADNDFENIPWVFTLDCYPYDIKFDESEKPVAGVYELDTQNADKYHKI